MKKTIIGVLIGIVIGIGITVGASVMFNANEIIYSNSRTTATNVKDALDELFENRNIEQVVSYGTTSSAAIYTYTFTKDYDYIIVSGSGTNNYNNDNAGIIITISNNMEVVNIYNNSVKGDGSYYSRMTSNLYKNIKSGDTITIRLGYGTQAVVYGIN